MPSRQELHDPKTGERLHPREVTARVRSSGLAGSLFEEIP
jgi:hypothetical protein